MGWPRDFLRTVAPPFVIRLYRHAKVAARSALRSLAAPVMTCRVRGVEVQVGISSPIERYRAESYSVKEPETLDWLEQNLRDDDVFMDVGANIGLYSLFAAKLRPRCVVYAFEPESQNYARLCQNIVINGVRNVIPCNCALSDREAFDLFYVGEVEAGSALHSLGQPNACRAMAEPAALKQGALTVTLDALVGNYGLPPPTLMKIDVDGTEGKILAGAEMVLKGEQLRTVLVEVTIGKGETSGSDPEQRLTLAGYRLFRTGASAQELNGMVSQNYIFQRP